MHRKEELFWGGVSLFGQVGAAFSTLALLSGSIEQNGELDVNDVLNEIALSAISIKFKTLSDALSIGDTLLSVANEKRETYRMSDGFVAQDGDSYVNILFCTNLGKEVSTYKVYFRGRNLSYVAVYDGDFTGQYTQGNFSGYSQIIENKWLNEGYVSR